MAQPPTPDSLFYKIIHVVHLFIVTVSFWCQSPTLHRILEFASDILHSLQIVTTVLVAKIFSTLCRFNISPSSFEFWNWNSAELHAIMHWRIINSSSIHSSSKFFRQSVSSSIVRVSVFSEYWEQTAHTAVIRKTQSLLKFT